MSKSGFWNTFAAGAFLFALTISVSATEAVDSYLFTVSEPAPAVEFLNLAGQTGLTPIRLSPAAEAVPGHLLQIAESNRAARARGEMLTHGIGRPLVNRWIQLDGVPYQAPHEALLDLADLRVWTTQIQVEQAVALRARFQKVRLPAGTTLHAQTEKDSWHRVLTSSMDAENLFTPTLPGNLMTIEVHLPTPPPEGAGFRLASIIEKLPLVEGIPVAVRNGTERFALTEDLSENTTCLLWGACATSSTLTSIESYREAVGVISFTRVIAGTEEDKCCCSGGLIRDEGGSGDHFFLTAAHCLRGDYVQGSFEAFFDYRTDQCSVGENSAFDSDSYKSFPSATGGVLLYPESGIRVDSPTDTALLQFPSLPSAGNPYAALGWTSVRPPDEAVLHRLSHPLVQPQAYSMSAHRADPPHSVVPEAPLSHYLYSAPLAGTHLNGSSGSPVVDGEGRVVGQLTGKIVFDGQNPDSCDHDGFWTLDGAFAAAYIDLENWLDPGDQPGGGSYDLVAFQPSVDDPTPTPGSSIRFSLSTTNIGDVTAPGNVEVSYFLGSTLVATDYEETSLAPGQVDGEAESFNVPTTKGTYVVRACLEGLPDEESLSNNCTSDLEIQVADDPNEGPDLIVVDTTISKSTVLPGETFEMSALVRNIGNLSSELTVVRFVDSVDGILDEEDPILESKAVNRLSPGRERWETDMVSAPTSPGGYLIGACVKARNDETNPNNNCSEAPLGLTVLTPPCEPKTVTLSNRSVTTSEMHEACESITVGPSLVVESGVDLSLKAPSIIFQDGFRVENGGTLTAGP